MRVRAGASPESVAAETGWALDRVQRYSDQILIERSWVAERARQVELRTVDGPITLGEMAESIVYAEGFDPQDLAWDSWRRPDGRWVVTATVETESGIVRGAWTYDTVGRTIHALDEAATWFMGASEARMDHLVEKRPVPPRADRTARPRLVAVHDEEELHEPAPRNEPAPKPAAAYRETIGVRRPERTRPIEPTRPTEPARPTEPTRQPQPTRQTQPTRQPETARAADETSDSADQQRPARQARGKGRKRASVPSWDEILFGATRGDD